MKKSLNLLSTLFISFLFFSCSSNIDPELLAKIEQRTDVTEDLFDKYSDLNEELMELIEEQDYYFNKLTKIKNSLRMANAKITSRQKRIDALKNPEVKEGEEAIPAPEKVIQPHLEKLAEYETEKAEYETEAAELLAQTQKFTSASLTLRKQRNTIYDQYTESRLVLKELNEQAADSTTE